MDTYITVTGRVVADPEFHETNNGVPHAAIRVVSNSRRFDRATGEFRDADPMFITVSCWRALADNVRVSLRKGDSVVIHGRLHYREYDDRNGVRRNVHEVDALAIGPDLSRWPVEVKRQARMTAEPPASAVPVSTEAQASVAA